MTKPLPWHPTQQLPGRVRMRPRPVRCSVCGADDRPILHFHLLLSVVKAGAHSTRGAGAIDLCEECWRASTGPAVIRRRTRRKAS